MLSDHPPSPNGTTTTAPAASAAQQDAQDLSRADREELLAFIEKRNWFEQKLDSLKSLAPVYPFVHPFLVPDPKSTAGYVRAGSEASPWRLPDRAQLSAWVSERNALEDEVSRFDDGDMERMKERTRQMTRVPLTQPSTDLVEVTLDLILLIDQLLTVLRKRGALLELALMRLEWDDLRYKVSREAESVGTEIQHVVSEAQAWIPGAPAPERLERRASTKLVSRPSLHSSPSTSSLNEADVQQPPPQGSTSTTPPTSPRKQTSPGRSRRVPLSPTKTGTAPKTSSLQFSILRSQLVGLQSRQRNFTITLVKPSSAILDKMIDAAGRLDGLGGISGPLQEGESIKGAIPEELIELQDTIEENANAMNERVKWCGEFETQCSRAHQHFMASANAQAIAGDVLVELEKALTFPASSTTQAALAAQFAAATRTLPDVLDASFPRPTHSEYPEKDVHNDKLIETLQAARDAAQADVDLTGKGLAFYSGMLKARDALLAQHQRVQTLRTQLAQTVERLERGTESVPRPNLEQVVRSGGDCSGWLQAAADWIATGDEVVRSATDTHQATTLAAMQYRKSLVSAPMAVKQYLPSTGVPDDLGPVVDDDASDLMALARRCADLNKTTRTVSTALPIVLCIRQDSDEVAADATALRDNIVIALNQAAWSSGTCNPPAPNHLEEEITRMSARIDDADRDLQRLNGIIGSTSTSQPLTERLKEVRGKIADARETLGTLNRVSNQAKLVLDIQAEAEEMLKDISAAREGVPKSEDLQALTSSVNALRQHSAAWNDSLTQRAIFISDNPPSLGSEASRERGDGPLTPPLTPVDAFSSNGTTMPDLVSLDARVRGELNRQSVRVSSALGQLVTSAEDAAFERWSKPVVKAKTDVEAATTKLAAVLADLAPRMESLKAVDGEERKTLAAEVQAAARDVLFEPVVHVQQCVAALNEALSSPTIPGVDIHRAADMFSSADVAREAGLAAVTDTEEWQKEVARLSLEAEVKLQKEKALALRTNAQPSAPQGGSTRSASAVQETVKELATKLDSLDLENVVRPSPLALRATPKIRRLPSSSKAKDLAASFAAINMSARTLASERKTPAVETLFTKLKRASTLVPELGGLGAVADASTACDTAFSALLDAIDEGAKGKIKTAERNAEKMVLAFRKAARAHKLDQRVVDEQKRVMRAWDDLRGLAEDEPLNSSASTTGSTVSSTSIRSNRSQSSFITRSSTTGSLSSLLSEKTVIQSTAAKKPQTRKSGNVLGATRNLTMPPPEVPKRSTGRDAPPARVSAAASETPSKPSRKPAASTLGRTKPLEKRSSTESIKGTPRVRSNSNLTSRTQTFVNKFKPTVPQPFNLSGPREPSTPSGGLTRSASATTSLSEVANTPTRNRSGPRLSAPSRTPVLAPTPKSQRPTQASKLDQAVAKVLDTLEVDVPVVPLGRDSPQQWHDESGRYWIGTGGRARLCFCRILRSRTVMVRVGGGWVELSRYLLDRFADVLAEQAAPLARETMSMSPPNWRRVPLAITTTTLNATQNVAVVSASVRSDGGLPPQHPHPRTPVRTPVRKPLPVFDHDSTTSPLLSPERQPLSLSPQGGNGQVGASSPLVPINFLRKASESPSVREKERERLRSVSGTSMGSVREGRESREPSLGL